MRHPLSLLLAAFFLVFVSGCGESDASKANKRAMKSEHSDITLKLARASEDAGDLPAAERLYRQVVEKDGSVANYLELADFYRRHNSPRQALVFLNEALKNDPQNTDVMRSIANAEIDMGQPDQAVDMLDKALAITNNDAMLYNSKGVALDMLGKYTQARNAYDTAISLDPQQAATFKTNLAMSYISTEYYTKAINLLLPLVESGNATPSTRQNLALAYGLKGDTENAMKYASKDLPAAQAEENMKFYTMMMNKLGSKKAAENKPGDKPAPQVSDKITNIPPIP
jgi:Flp pilus assembly protein TadD